MTRFLLIRHGETDMVGTRLSGRMPGVHLNLTGQRQAELLAARLQGMDIAALYASPLERAQETAKPLARVKQLDIQISPSLAELDYGEWTGRTFHELAGDPAWQRFNAHRSTACVPGGESVLSVQGRAVAELERLREVHDETTVALISHAEWIRSAVLHYLGVPLDLFLRVEVSPASVTTLDLTDGPPTLRGLNAL